MILVSSFPKSGATWFQFLMYACRFGEIKRSYDVLRWYPEDFRVDEIRQKLESPEPFFVKTHIPYSQFLPWQAEVSACICLYRNPLDVCVSKFNHYKYEGVDWVYEKEGLRKFVAEFIREAPRGPYEISENHRTGGWDYHTQAWFNAREKLKVSFVSYEALLEDTFTEIFRINDELALGLSDGAIRKGCELASFENLKALEEKELRQEIGGMFYSPKRREAFMKHGVQFMNKGKKANYKDILSKTEIDAITQACRQGMKLAHYL